jgi:Fe-S-cluster containining protein
MERNQSASPLLAVNLPEDESAPVGSRVLRSEVPVFDETVSVRVHVADVSARLADLMPLARWLDERIIDSAVRQARTKGWDISCSAGCCACCSYLIPLSLPEAFCLWDNLLAMSGERRELLGERFTTTAQRLLRKPFQPSPCQSEHAAVEEIGQWYAELEIPCPLLENALCSEYDIRPLACREYMVISPPEHCEGRSPHTATRVDLPVSVAESCMELAATMEGSEPEGIILASLLAWLGDNLPRHEQTYPAIEMFRTFLQIISRRVRTDLHLPDRDDANNASDASAGAA